MISLCYLVTKSLNALLANLLACSTKEPLEFVICKEFSIFQKKSADTQERKRREIQAEAELNRKLVNLQIRSLQAQLNKLPKQ